MPIKSDISLKRVIITPIYRASARKPTSSVELCTVTTRINFFSPPRNASTLEILTFIEKQCTPVEVYKNSLDVFEVVREFQKVLQQVDLCLVGGQNSNLAG